MNTVEAHFLTDPYNKVDECAKFSIDDPATPFTMNGVATVGKRYTFSMWLQADAEGSVGVGGEVFQATTTWEKHSVTFTATSENVLLTFGTAGTYYIYHAQLEVGNKATDWTPAPEDVDGDIQTAQNTADDAKDRVGKAETIIQQLADSISMLVRDGDGGSLIRQDADGLWFFDIGGLEQNISDTANDLDDLSGIVLDANGKIDVLQSLAAALAERTEYVRSYTDENDQPCLELGEGDSTFKVQITNTEIQFLDGTTKPAYISNQKLMIEQAEVKDELQFGGFIWKSRNNGNIGLMWKGVSS